MHSDLIIGIDPSFSNMGVVIFEHGKVSWPTCLTISSSRNKDKSSFVTEVKCHRAYESFKFYLDNLSKSVVAVDAGEIRRMNILYATLLAVLEYRISMLPIFPGIHVGVEIPMGSHQGGGAKIDRVYAVVVMVLCELEREVRRELGDLHIYAYTPGQIKKFVTGKGNAKKDLMLKEVYKRWDFETDIHDIADAYGIAKLVESNII